MVEEEPGKLLRSLEEELLKNETRKSAERLRKLLAEDFVEFGSSGRIYNREAIVTALAAEPSAELELSSFEMRELAPDLALVTYRTCRIGPSCDQRRSLRSSIWKRGDGRWQMLFHQGTPIGTRTAGAPVEARSA